MCRLGDPSQQPLSAFALKKTAGVRRLVPGACLRFVFQVVVQYSRLHHSRRSRQDSRSAVSELGFLHSQVAPAAAPAPSGAVGNGCGTQRFRCGVVRAHAQHVPTEQNVSGSEPIRWWRELP